MMRRNHACYSTHYRTVGTLWWCLWEIQPHKEKSRWLWSEIAYSIKKFERMTFWAMIHMPLSRRTGVEAKAEDHLGIISQEADPSLEGK